jgi:hypothetical protein
MLNSKKKLIFDSLTGDERGGKKSPQEIQDEIFRNMSADRKIEIAAQLWQLGQELKKQNHGNNRSAETPRGSRKNLK